MWKSTSLFAVTTVLLITSCNYKTETSTQQQIPSPPPTAQVSPGGGKPPAAGVAEVGDTSPTQFTGTAGIVEKTKSGIEPVVLETVRTGSHPTFDRVVFEFRGKELPGYHVEYVDKPVRSCGSGEVVEMSGAGFLQVRMMPAQAHDEKGQPTIQERELKPNHPVLKELKTTCDFEADVEWILGLGSPNRYRVLELTNPPRLVVDVNH